MGQRVELLEALRSDLTATREDLDRAIDDGESLLDRSGGFLDAVHDGEEISRDSLLVLFEGVWDVPFFEPTLASYRTSVNAFPPCRTAAIAFDHGGRTSAEHHGPGHTMRQLKIIEHISLDGVIQHSADDDDFPYGGWTAPYRSPEGLNAILAAQGDSFDLLLGRRTYDIWSNYWPKSPSNPMADRLNSATAAGVAGPGDGGHLQRQCLRPYLLGRSS